MMTLASRRRALQTTALAGVLFAAGCSQQTAPRGIPHSDVVTSTPATISGRIDRTADAWVGSGKAVGVVIEVAQSGRVIFARGYGRPTLERPDPVTTQTQFRIGSLTKQFTAAAILQLVGQGKLSLDDRLSTYFPDFPRGSQVTIRQLLTHTSGVHNYTEFGFDPWTLYQFTRDHTTLGWVAHIAHQKPLYDFPPGTAWHYDNSGFFLLGAIVEKISGEPLGRYFHDHLFRPLGMNDTAIDGNSDIGPDRAEGYERAHSAGAFKRAIRLSMTVPGGAGALRSSARDLVKWNDALFQGRVVSRDLLQLMITPARLSDGRLSSENRFDMDPAEPHGEYGFGIRVERFDGFREIGHEGDIPGFNAAMDTYPDDDQLTVVVLANTPAGALGLEKQIAAVFLTSAPHGGAKAAASRPPT